MAPLRMTHCAVPFVAAALIWIGLLMSTLASAQAPDPPPAFRITEFVAVNNGTVLDEDGSAPDWIEVQNISGNAASLDGWYLTDDRAVPAKWRFPATNLNAGAFALVFASGKNRSAPGAPLHASFALDAAGGYLGLIRPDGVTVASEFNYGPQFAGASFGLGRGPSARTDALIDTNTPMRYLVPPGPVADTWRGGAAFDDASWGGGFFPAGFDANPRPVVTAYSVPAGTVGNQAYGGALGLDFDVTTPVRVTDLGCFDESGNGIGAGITITVALWRRNNAGTPAVPGDDAGAGIIVQTNFTAAAPGTLLGGQRFKALPAPIALTNGSYTIVAYGYGAAERLANNLGVVTPNAAGALAFVGRSRYGDNTAAFPPTTDVNVAQYAAGTFRFQTAPVGTFATRLSAMHQANASALFRIPFALAETNFSELTLNVAYDDGFVAYLNGVEIARRNAPATLAFDSAAPAAGGASESFDVSVFLGQLRAGANLLALQGLNAGAGDADFLLSATLSARGTATNTLYFTAPTPGEPNGPGLSFPRVVLNELHVDPVNSKSRFVEFIELYNPLPAAVDVSGWSFTRGVTYTFPAGTTIAPRGYLVVAENPSALATNLGANALGPWTGSLANDGETLELVDANAAVVDVVHYGLGFPWPTVGDNDASMQLIHEGLDNDLGGAWRSAPPTPGARNSLVAGPAPPLVRQVGHSPNQPASGELVTVTAKVTDSSGVAAVFLEYQVVLPGSYLPLTDPAFATNWTTVVMRDDGNGGDVRAFDGVFTAQVPASVQQHRRLIRYRIQATNSAGLGVRVPYADDASPNFAYFVYDGVPAWTGAVQPGVTPPQTFGTNITRQVRPYHLISRSNDVYNCQYNSAFNDGTYRFEGALVVDGKVYDHVHYRAKGQNSTYNTGKNKWKFQFNRGHWFEMPDDYGESSTAVEILNVSSLPSSWAPWNRGMAGLDERMQYRLTELAGVPSPRASYFQLRVIDDALEQPATQYDGDLWGLYMAFENQDNRFKDAHGLPDGNIFRMQTTSGGNRLLGQGSGQPANLSDLNAFVSTATGYNRTTLQPEAWWATNVDLARYFSWRAVNEAVNNTDIRDQENVVYFRDPISGLWHLEPWDCDLLYEQFDRWGPEATQSIVAYEQIRRCLQHTNILISFQNRARELQDLLLNADQSWKLVDEFLSLITDGGPTQPGFVEVDRRRWDYNPANPTAPRANGNVGQYYKTPYPVPNMGLGPPQPFFRTLASPDFAGLVSWVKSFLVLDAHGGARLTALANDPTIPATPTVTYTGGPGFPADGLTFQGDAFVSPVGRAFAAMQWRLGEVFDPSVPNFTPGAAWRYEITEVWSSGELTALDNTLALPATVVREGHTYRARARFKDASGRWSHWSSPTQFTAGTSGTARLAQSLIVSELMYNPPARGAVSGDEFEFIELKNVGAHALNLGGLAFTAGITFEFPPDTFLASGATFLLARNPEQLALKHPGVVVQGVYTGRLDNGGETITLTHPTGGTVLSFTYDDALPWPLAADNFDFSLVPVTDTATFDHDNPDNWRASGAPGGSPGGDDPPAAIPPVRVNEVMANTDLPAVDWVELFNPTTNRVDVGGWFLTDDPATPEKFRIPDGTFIGPLGFVVFTEADFNSAPGASNSFSLRSRGDEIVLSSGDAQTNLTGYSHGFAFGAAARGVTFGRYVNSVGEEQFPAQEAPSPGAPNAGPRTGPVVLSEIHYHPAPGGTGVADEFLELRNVSASAVALFEGTNGWRLAGVGYTFPTNLSIGAGGTLLLVATDPAAFRARYGLPLEVEILGPYASHLQDSGERLELQQPDDSDTNGVAYIAVDAVRYNDRAPWPVAADGSGASLQRRVARAYGDDPANWDAATPTPGTAFAGGQTPAIVSQPRSQSVFPGQSASFSIGATGTGPLQYQWTFNGRALPGATSSNLALSSVQFAQAGNYSVTVFNQAGSVASAVAHLTVSTPLLLLSSPTNQAVRPGGNATFQVLAVSSSPIRYQWQRDGLSLPGATTSSLSIPNAQLADAGAYSCQLTDALGTVSTPPAQLILLVDPLITLSPLSQNVVAGATVVLSVTVTNSATLPLGYRLRRNGSTLPTTFPGAFYVLNQRTAYFTLSGTNTTPPWTSYAIIVTNLARPSGILSATATLTFDADTDGDGLPDDWERAHFGSATGADRLADPDGDGLLNWEEHVAGTDPMDRASYLKIDSLAASPTTTVSFLAVSNRTYTVHYTDGLPSGSWFVLAEVPARATNRVEQVPDLTATTNRFYRLVTPRQP